MKRKTIFVAGGIACLVAIGGFAIWTREIPYQQWDSKDGTLQVVVKKRWLYCYLPVMPGQGGDAPGSVLVREKSTGNTLLRKNVDMVSMAGDEIGEFRER